MQNGAKKIIIYISFIVIGFTTGYKFRCAIEQEKVQEARAIKSFACTDEQNNKTSDA
jgi:hypothetical protein